MYRRLHCSQKPRLALIFFSVRVLPLPLLGMRVLRTREFYIEIKETYVPYEKFMITLEFEQDDDCVINFTVLFPMQVLDVQENQREKTSY